MRRSRKKEVIRIFAALHKAHNILAHIGASNLSEAKHVFTTCQNGAIQIGTEIERWEGEGTQTVRLLEDYCETVYQCSISQSVHGGDVIYQKMEKSLRQAEDSFKTEIPDDKLEVVFFPYQASMWDSLASVWKAASNDASCHASVIPIPYFEKNPDGSFGKMHYEGNRFPADIPITPWETYDVAQQYPDLIFIHNPYDQNNFVTSIHPNYYASVLENFTGNLIYIPYYLFVNNKVFENTLMTSASLYADYFIVQSEETCTKCIRIYDNFLKKNKLAGKLKQGKDKFLPLGSPIGDSLQQKISIKDMPKSWQDIVSKHGSHPKIVMYNTHLSNLMCMKENNFFRKIEYVFETFQSQRDIVLLWRPHPLTWQTIHSMNPQAAEKYAALVERYQSEAWGIFDDTSSVNQSVILADAYYGDWSSLITMFSLLGKPALMQNLEILENSLDPEHPCEHDFNTLINESELGLKDYLTLIKEHMPAQKEIVNAGITIWNYLKDLN